MIPAMPRRSPTAAAIAAIAAVVLAALVAAPRPAAARSERTVSFPIERVWPTAVRFLRVDEGLAIVDKDAEAGYVVFELKDKGKTFRGALELVAIVDGDGRTAVRLVMTIDGRPEYTESGLLDRLLAKVHREYGEPPPAPAPEKPARGDKPKQK
jgi:hypothetical protein